MSNICFVFCFLNYPGNAMDGLCVVEGSYIGHSSVINPCPMFLYF